ncbi:MAG: hypothetical protein JST82_13180 [Bacteroidetes bacterium]|nr:hypothetical protein [Bacteroidota bacterium]
MQKQHYILYALLASISLFACKKNNKSVEPTVTPPISYDNYTVLKQGNYWIYQNYQLDSINGTAKAMGTYDSCFVEKDTIINNNTYHKYCSQVLFTSQTTPEYTFYYLRDSLGYTVNHYGIIIFASTDFTSVFRTYTFGPNLATPDTLIIKEQMGFKDASVIVDAGTFITSAFRRIYYFPQNYKYGNPREYDYHYAKNIGLVKETTAWYYPSPMLYERRLVRYHVN